jgi:hypothetical protein
MTIISIPGGETKGLASNSEDIANNARDSLNLFIKDKEYFVRYHYKQNEFQSTSDYEIRRKKLIFSDCIAVIDDSYFPPKFYTTSLVSQDERRLLKHWAIRNKNSLLEINY